MVPCVNIEIESSLLEVPLEVEVPMVEEPMVEEPMVEEVVEDTPPIMEQEETAYIEDQDPKLKNLYRLQDVQSRISYITDLIFLSNERLCNYLRKVHGPGIEESLKEEPWLYSIPRDSQEFADSSIKEQHIIDIHEDVAELERIVVFQNRMVYNHFKSEESMDQPSSDDEQK